MPLTWLITGCTSGFGRELAEQVLARGDNAVLTARAPAALDALAQRHPDRTLVRQLDVTRRDEIQATFAAALERFGRIDVLVNNAGYGLIGAVEEVSAEEYRRLFETNVFGTLETVRTALPIMRQQRSGTIVQVSSNLGVTARAGYGLYSASKFALEGYSEALAAEIQPHGIRVIVVEPGAFRTNFLGRSIGMATTRLDAYDDTVGQIRALREERQGHQPGDPRRGVSVIVQAVDASRPPLHLPLGPDAFRNIRAKLARVTSDLDAWEPVASDTDIR